VNFCYLANYRSFKKYNDINFGSPRITDKLSLKDILDFKEYKFWHIDNITERVIGENKIEIFLEEAPDLLNLNTLMDSISWETLAKFHYLPWDLEHKIIYDTHMPTLYQIRKLKDKNLNIQTLIEYLGDDKLYLGEDMIHDYEILRPTYHLYCDRKNKIQIKNMNMKRYTRLHVMNNQWDWIEPSIYLDWDVEELGKTNYHKIPPLTLLKYYDDVKWNWKILSRKVPFDDILDTPNFNWNFNIIKKRRGIPFEFVKEFPVEWNFNNILTLDKREENILIVLPLLQKKLPYDLTPYIIEFIL